MNFTKHERTLVQRALNELTAANLSTDGAIGPASLKAIANYRAKEGIAGSGLDTALWTALTPYITRRFVQISDMVQAAKAHGIPPSMILTIWEKESRGSGFLRDGRLSLLFERHIFYKYAVQSHGRTQAERWRKEHPNLCDPVWDAKVYAGGAGEWRRLEQARMLDATIALMSASWGLYQLMGFNYTYTRFNDVQSMVSAFSETEHEHLHGLIGFIVNQPELLHAMREKDFHTVARIYNGRSYARHGYHTDLMKIQRNFASYDNL